MAPPPKATQAKAKAGDLAPPPKAAKAKAKAGDLAPPPEAKAKAGDLVAQALAKGRPLVDGDFQHVGTGSGPTTIWCDDCNRYQSFQKARLTTKGAAPGWRCGTCTNSRQQLYRGFGAWPPKEWSEIPTEDRVAFMRDVEGKSPAATIAAADTMMTKYEKREDWYEDGGQFLPLSVWETKGFNIENIRNLTPQSDTQNHPVLGLCYRVKLLATGGRGVSGKRFDARNNKGTKRPIADVAPEQPKMEQEEGKGDDDESSGSSSSSSSEDRPHYITYQPSPVDIAVSRLFESVVAFFVLSTDPFFCVTFIRSNLVLRILVLLIFGVSNFGVPNLGLRI